MPDERRKMLLINISLRQIFLADTAKGPVSRWTEPGLCAILDGLNYYRSTMIRYFDGAQNLSMSLILRFPRKLGPSRCTASASSRLWREMI